jgi:tyrosinase
MIRHNVLTNTQAREDFIEGVHLLKQQPWTDGLGIYDFFVYWHFLAMMEQTPNPPNPSGSLRNAAHNGPVFLPWHRYMLLVRENELRIILSNDDFRIPYWDWTSDSPAPGDSGLWADDVMGGLGFPVSSGPFQRNSSVGREWEIKLAMNPSTGQLQRVSRGLRRDLGVSGSIPSASDVRDALLLPTYDALPWDNNSSFNAFRQRAESLHNVVHVWIGNRSGDMSLATSPNDPVFFLHHANVDRLWRAWQEQYGLNVYSPDTTEPDFLNSHRKGDTLFNLLGDTITPNDMLGQDATYTYDTLAF